MGRSMELRQCWQVMSSVVRILAIVWCSPQFGHCETSSKRRRQYTHRKRPGSWVGRSHGSPHPGQGGRESSAVPSGSSAIRPCLARSPGGRR